MAHREMFRGGKYFVAIADTTSDMIHLNDDQGRIVYANPATEQLLGYPLDDLIGTAAFAIIHPEDRQAIGNDMASISNNRLPPPREIRLRRQDGAWLDAEVRGFQVDLDERERYIGAVIRDISIRRRNERELADYRNHLEALVRDRTRQLEAALDQIKILKGILPICSFCKKIRDDKGYWNHVEDYIQRHSEVDFSHGVCPDCLKKHYPKL